MAGHTRSTKGGAKGDDETKLSPIKRRAARHAAEMEAALQQHYPTPDDLETPATNTNRTLDYNDATGDSMGINPTKLNDDDHNKHDELMTHRLNDERRQKRHNDDDNDMTNRGRDNDDETDSLSFLDDDDGDEIRAEFILDEALAATDLPPEYFSEKHAINSIPDLVVHTIARFEDLRDAVKDEMCGGELKEGIKRFILGFKSRKAKRDNTLTAAGTMYHLGNIGPTLSLITRKALMSGVGENDEELSKLIERAEQGMPVPQKEVRRADLRLINWTKMLQLTVAMACRVTNFEQKLIEAEEKWENLGMRFERRAEVALAAETKWWNKCKQYLGYELTSLFKRMENLRKNAPDPVNAEFTRIIAETKGMALEMKLYKKWHQFEEVFYDAWESAEGKGLLKGLEAKAPQPEKAEGSTEPSCHTIAKAGTLMTGEEVAEQLLECDQCNSKFTLTPADISRMRGKGQTRMPGTCKVCRDQSVECREMKEKGNCSYGDNCRFKHGEKRTKACRAFSMTGKCRLGDQCEFAHSREKTDVSETQEEAQVYSALIDAHFGGNRDDDTQSEGEVSPPVVYFAQIDYGIDSDLEF